MRTSPRLKEQCGYQMTDCKSWWLSIGSGGGERGYCYLSQLTLGKNLVTLWDYIKNNLKIKIVIPDVKWQGYSRSPDGGQCY